MLSLPSRLQHTRLCSPISPSLSDESPTDGFDSVHRPTTARYLPIPLSAIQPRPVSRACPLRVYLLSLLTTNSGYPFPQATRRVLRRDSPSSILSRPTHRFVDAPPALALPPTTTSRPRRDSAAVAGMTGISLPSGPSDASPRPFSLTPTSNSTFLAATRRLPQRSRLPNASNASLSHRNPATSLFPPPHHQYTTTYLHRRLGVGLRDDERAFLLPLPPFPLSLQPPLSPPPLLDSQQPSPRLYGAAVRVAAANPYLHYHTPKEVLGNDASSPLRSLAALAAAPPDPNPAAPPTPTYSPRRILVSPPIPPSHRLIFTPNSTLNPALAYQSPLRSPSTPSTTLSALRAPTDSKFALEIRIQIHASRSTRRAAAALIDTLKNYDAVSALRDSLGRLR
ncbi:hypothetical protein R3P38DRAFT_3601670 [Favolaschia claudopus]|uniref:Uncharacterized protein n=1 Tax=Favolaschia claudopus TaxID=2862362 RepID=A0AAW0ABN0_9AGAR